MLLCLFIKMYCLGFQVSLSSINMNMIASLLPMQKLQLLSCFIGFICLRISSKRALFLKFELCVIGLDHLSVVKGLLLADSAEKASEMLWLLNPQTVWHGGRTSTGCISSFGSALIKRKKEPGPETFSFSLHDGVYFVFIPQIS